MQITVKLPFIFRKELLIATLVTSSSLIKCSILFLFFFFEKKSTEKYFRPGVSQTLYRHGTGTHFVKMQIGLYFIRFGEGIEKVGWRPSVENNQHLGYLGGSVG